MWPSASCCYLTMFILLSRGGFPTCHGHPRKWLAMSLNTSIHKCGMIELVMGENPNTPTPNKPYVELDSSPCSGLAIPKRLPWRFSPTLPALSHWDSRSEGHLDSPPHIKNAKTNSWSWRLRNPTVLRSLWILGVKPIMFLCGFLRTNTSDLGPSESWKCHLSKGEWK